jgi:hypothetical protein
MRGITAKYLLFLAFLALSCDKVNTPAFGLNCRQLKNGIINSDQDAIGNEISKLTQDLVPKPTIEDNIGHSANFDLLIERLNQCEETSAQLICYCCILTYPAQSEILISTYSDRKNIVQIIDIITPRDSVLVYRTIHDANE